MRKGEFKTISDYPPPVRDEKSGCLRWQGPKIYKGYGRFRQTTVHRYIWEQLNGPIPEGMEIDHVLARGCVYRDCIELSHLEAVTRVENNRRKPLESKLASIQFQLSRTHCRNGHAYEGYNVMRLGPNRTRRCRTCFNRAKNKYRKKKKIEGFVRNYSGGGLWKRATCYAHAS